MSDAKETVVVNYSEPTPTAEVGAMPGDDFEVGDIATGTTVAASPSRNLDVAMRIRMDEELGCIRAGEELTMKASTARALAHRLCESAAEADRANKVPCISDEAIAAEPMLQLFRWSHLPPHLQAASRPFGELALRLVETTPRNPERTVALRKLREAKDCAITALLWKASS